MKLLQLITKCQLVHDKENKFIKAYIIIIPELYSVWWQINTLFECVNPFVKRHTVHECVIGIYNKESTLLVTKSCLHTNIIIAGVEQGNPIHIPYTQPVWYNRPISFCNIGGDSRSAVRSLWGVIIINLLNTSFCPPLHLHWFENLIKFRDKE